MESFNIFYIITSIENKNSILFLRWKLERYSEHSQLLGRIIDGISIPTPQRSEFRFIRILSSLWLMCKSIITTKLHISKTSFLYESLNFCQDYIWWEKILCLWQDVSSILLHFFPRYHRISFTAFCFLQYWDCSQIFCHYWVRVRFIGLAEM